MSDHVIPDPLSRARARLDLVLERLSAAKDANPKNFCPIEPADAEALYGLVFTAEEDLDELREALSGNPLFRLTPRLHEVINVDEPATRSA